MSTTVVLLATLAKTLLLTIAFETPLALPFLRERTWRDFSVVALAQVATNPLVELTCIAVRWDPSLPFGTFPWIVMLAAELAAFVAEALLYRMAGVTEHPWLMSGALNGISFASGVVLVLIKAI